MPDIILNMAQAMVDLASIAANESRVGTARVANTITCQASEVTWVDLMKVNMIASADDIIVCLSLSRALKMHEVRKKTGLPNHFL